MYDFFKIKNIEYFIYLFLQSFKITNKANVWVSFETKQYKTSQYSSLKIRYWQLSQVYELHD